MDEAETFELELVEPERRVIDGPMWQAVIPGTEGEFGVRAGHSPLVSSLQPGVVTLWRSPDEHPHSYFISGGFADVTGEHCIVLAEDVVEIKHLDREALQQTLQELEDRHALTEDPAEKAAIAKKVSIARAKMDVLDRSRK